MTVSKSHIRHEVRERIAGLSREERTYEATRVSQYIRELWEYIRAETLVGYRAMGDEIDISELLDIAARDGKEVIIVSQSPDDGFPGIPDTKNTLIFVPWRAFTHSGERIGRWGGWYDRFLSSFHNVSTIGICYSVQLYNELPQDRHDIRVVRVVTWAPREL